MLLRDAVCSGSVRGELSGAFGKLREAAGSLAMPACPSAAQKISTGDGRVFMKFGI